MRSHGRCPRLVLAAITLLVAAPAAAHAAVTFSSTAYPLPVADSTYNSRLGAVAVVDLNNDSHPDIVIHRSGGSVGKVIVLLNQGNGSFGPAQEYQACANSSNGAMVTGRFDSDQYADVIVGCEAGTGLDELLGNGDGTLGTATHTNGIGLNSVFALWPGDNGGVPNVLWNQSAGESYLTYAPVNDLAHPVAPPDTSHCCDANGDPDGHAAISLAPAVAHFYANDACPRDDLIVSPFGTNIRVWGENPFGDPDVSHNFPPCSSLAYTERAVQGIPSGESLRGISAADLNGDGNPDLLMTTNGSSLIALLWQTGGADLAGGFPPGQQSVVTASTAGIEDQQVADFDGDGHPDAALAVEPNSGPPSYNPPPTGTLAIHLGHGDGSFDTPPLTFAIPGGGPDGFNSIGPNFLAVGDLDGDGSPDVVSIAQYDGSATVLLNTTAGAGGGGGGGGGGSGGSGGSTVPVTAGNNQPPPGILQAANGPPIMPVDLDAAVLADLSAALHGKVSKALKTVSWTEHLPAGTLTEGLGLSFYAPGPAAVTTRVRNPFGLGQAHARVTSAGNVRVTVRIGRRGRRQLRRHSHAKLVVRTFFVSAATGKHFQSRRDLKVAARKG